MLAAYGFSSRKDLLAQLLELNLSVAAQIERGEPVTAPGIPPGFPNPEILITDDCIQPPTSPDMSTPSANGALPMPRLSRLTHASSEGTLPPQPLMEPIATPSKTMPASTRSSNGLR